MSLLLEGGQTRRSCPRDGRLPAVFGVTAKPFMAPYMMDVLSILRSLLLFPVSCRVFYLMALHLALAGRSETITIGRSTRLVTVVLDLTPNTISRRHAEIVYTKTHEGKDVFAIKDLV